MGVSTFDSEPNIHILHEKDNFWVNYPSFIYQNNVVQIFKNKPIDDCQVECGKRKDCYGIQYDKKEYTCTITGKASNWKFNMKRGDNSNIFLYRIPKYNSFEQDCITREDNKNHGYAYNGKINFVNDPAKPCVAWEKQLNYTEQDLNGRTWKDVKNYCRNPKSSNKQVPWCYTQEPDLSATFCTLLECETRDCITVDDKIGKSYTGKQDHPSSGSKPCRPWTEQKNFTSDDLKVEFLEDAKNYCRNPLGKSKEPWCFTKPNGKAPLPCKQIPKCKSIFIVKDKNPFKRQYYALFHNVDYRGHDIKKLSNKNAECCAILCRRDARCIGFTMKNSGSKDNCILKSAISDDEIDAIADNMKNYERYSFYYRLPSPVYKKK